MPYYQGDYYGYGDPGFFSFVGKAAKLLGGKIPIVGGAVEALGGAMIKRGARSAAPAAAGVAETGIQKIASTIIKHPVMTAAGAAATTGTLAAGGMSLGAAAARKMVPTAVKGPSMAHMRYMKRLKMGHIDMPRRRRMNSCNIHALRRAIRRAQSFSRIAKKVLRFTSPRPPKGHAYFKHRKRAKRI